MSTNEPMTQEQLNEIQRQVNATTRRLRDIERLRAFANGEAGARITAHAPQDVADLLAEVERLRALTTVDDDMVERAARALYLRESDWSSEAKWDRLPEFARESWRKTARAALDAALGTGEDT